jgi:hypothetical protein
VALDELEGSTGWDLKPEGACLGDLCVPIPRGHEAEFVADSAFNVVALAKHIGQPAERHEPSQTWAVGESAMVRGSNLHSLRAPDFTLPDADGSLRALADFRGRKVFLVSWASW